MDLVVGDAVTGYEPGCLVCLWCASLLTTVWPRCGAARFWGSGFPSLSCLSRSGGLLHLEDSLYSHRDVAGPDWYRGVECRA